jgi:hypothetical protein
MDVPDNLFKLVKGENIGTVINNETSGKKHLQTKG